MTVAESVPPAERIAPAGFTLRELLAYFLWLGTFGFGGPIALVGYMQRDLVERRRCFSKQDYSEGLALAQLAPGPLAAQLAIYLGWLKAGTLGATLVAGAFILPSFLMVLLLSFAYLRFEGLAWMQGVFYGIGAAVIAIIARSVWKLVRSTLERDAALWIIFLALPPWGRRERVPVAERTPVSRRLLAAIITLRRLPEPLVIVVAGGVGLLARTWIGEGT